MKHSIKYIIYQEGKYFVSQCLNIDVSSFGETIEESQENLMEAVSLYLEDNVDSKNFIPIGDMYMGKKTAMNIREQLFWDIDKQNFDAEKNKTLIIERVLNYGTLSEFKSMLNFYGYETIRQELKRVGYLEPKTLVFVTSFFNINKNMLRCYTKKQSNQPRWN